MRRIVIIIAALTVAGGLWWFLQPRHPARVNANDYESEMTAGLVRGILREIGPGGPEVCFLAFGEGATPPSPGFIARLADCHPAVRSAGSSVSPPVGQYFETSTGRPGLVIRIVRFKEFIPGTFDVVVAFSNLPAGRDHFVYRISAAGGDWTINSRKPE
jgi:hypothetical protein